MELANSQAMVKVYIGDRNLATYHVPNNAGTLWDVCTYDIKTNTLTPVNKVYFHPGDSSNVGIEPIVLARNNLISNIAKYECYDFGPEKAEEIQQKLQDARNCVNSDVDYDTIVSCSNALEEYFRELEESTRISEIYAEDLRDTYIYRQGNYYYDEETDEENRLHGYSIIKLTGRSGEFSTELEIVLHQENASYDWTSISLESYYNIKYVVTEEEGQHYVSIMSNDVEVEKYPLYYERNIGSFEFHVTAEENTVTCQKD